MKAPFLSSRCSRDGTWDSLESTPGSIQFGVIRVDGRRNARGARARSGRTRAAYITESVLDARKPPGRRIGWDHREEGRSHFRKREPIQRRQNRIPGRHRRRRRHGSDRDPKGTQSLAAEDLETRRPAPTTAPRNLLRGSRVFGLAVTARDRRDWRWLTTGTPGLAARLLIAEPGRMPALVGRLFNVSGSFHMMGAGPGHFLLGTVTTAMVPASVGVAAAARMVLTGERPAAILGGKLGHGHADGRDQVRHQSHAGGQPA
jgi:hypothetical protein